MLATIMLYCHVVGAAENATDASEKLSVVNYFSIGFNGFVGQKSDGEHYVEKILADKNSERILINIARNERATTEAKLYAACGLRRLSDRNLDGLFKSSYVKPVSVLKADVLRKEKFHDVYSWIQRHGCSGQ